MRRRGLIGMAAAGWAGALSPAPTIAQAGPAAAAASGLLQRRIPSSGEALPAIGLGSWITFNVGDDPPARDACAEVVRAFLAGGGRLIDSSPMYGSSPSTIGHGLRRAGAAAAPLFSAEKVWVGSGARGAAQIETSRERWGVARFDLIQVHNLLGFDEHWPRLQEMKRAGRVRYLGITTSEGRRHDEFERIMKREPLDFVQFSYNLRDREVEQRLLPLAAERGIAVIVNRPFREGALLKDLARHRMPEWAARELGCDGWAGYALKFILAHPAVTCAIPATSRVDHVRQNLRASAGPLPDAGQLRRMRTEIDRL